MSRPQDSPLPVLDSSVQESHPSYDLADFGIAVHDWAYNADGTARVQKTRRKKLPCPDWKFGSDSAPLAPSTPSVSSGPSSVPLVSPAANERSSPTIGVPTPQKDSTTLDTPPPISDSLLSDLLDLGLDEDVFYQ